MGERLTGDGELSLAPRDRPRDVVRPSDEPAVGAPNGDLAGPEPRLAGARRDIDATFGHADGDRPVDPDEEACPDRAGPHHPWPLSER